MTGSGELPTELIPVCGEIDIASAPRLLSRIDSVLLRGRPVVLDLESVSFMDAAGFRVLIRAAQLATGLGTTLTLRRPSKAVTRLISLLGTPAGLTLDFGEERAQPSGVTPSGQGRNVAIPPWRPPPATSAGAAAADEDNEFL